jgi:hypothetical protein
MKTEKRYYCAILNARLEPVTDNGEQLKDKHGRLAWAPFVTYASTGEEEMKDLFFAKANQNPDDVLLNWLIRWNYDFEI